MLARVRSAVVIGVDAHPVEVEIDLSSGLPSFTTVGLPQSAVKEGRERVAAAVANSGFEFPLRRITVNLAPADVPKAGSAFDLPIAVGLLLASQQVVMAASGGGAESGFLFGELSLEGALRPIRGAISVVMCARHLGARWVILPAPNAEEGALVGDIEVFGAKTLLDVVRHLAGRTALPAATRSVQTSLADGSADFADVRGQEMAKRALEVAAAGGHNAIMVGPPGSGKTMLARRLPSILPSLTREESLEVIKVHSVAGVIKNTPGAISRPFRAPHHTISDAGLIGGGPFPRPGEVSLAHHGVLFLDELPEFRRNVLEALRQPLEDGYVTIARASASVVFPARFMVVAAMNPCPCGYHGDSRTRCSCSDDRIDKYRARISGPLFDRFDVQLAVTNPTWLDLAGADAGESSATVQMRVERARAVQLDRYRNLTGVFANAHLSASQLNRWCQLEADGARLLARAAERLGLSARAHGKVLRLARTIADLGGVTEIRSADVAEAVQYRGLDRVRAPG